MSSRKYYNVAPGALIFKLPPLKLLQKSRLFDCTCRRWVTERAGSVIRFNDAFLEFLRTFGIVPWACNPGQPHEKGKIENTIKYIRQNFWPLRSFKDLEDFPIQADHWRDRVANLRIHGTTGQRPIDRFQPDRLKPLPEILPDDRETNPAKVHKDFSVRFDGNGPSVKRSWPRRIPKPSPYTTMISSLPLIFVLGKEKTVTVQRVGFNFHSTILNWVIAL